MKNNIISLNQLKKRKQNYNRLNIPETHAAGSNIDKFIVPAELNEKYNTEYEEDFSSGMLIW